MQTFAVDECIPSVATTKNVKKIPLYGKLLTKKKSKSFLVRAQPIERSLGLKENKKNTQITVKNISN